MARVHRDQPLRRARLPWREEGRERGEMSRDPLLRLLRQGHGYLRVARFCGFVRRTNYELTRGVSVSCAARSGEVDVRAAGCTGYGRFPSSGSGRSLVRSGGQMSRGGGDTGRQASILLFFQDLLLVRAVVAVLRFRRRQEGKQGEGGELSSNDHIAAPPPRRSSGRKKGPMMQAPQTEGRGASSSLSQNERRCSTANPPRREVTMQREPPLLASPAADDGCHARPLRTRHA